MKRLICDLDGTITYDAKDRAYPDKEPNLEVVAQLRRYKAEGFQIVIHSSRQMRTYEGNLGMINANTLPVIIEWLAKHDIPYDEIYVGKPWSGFEGFYIDDKAIRPREFVTLTYEEILARLHEDSWESKSLTGD